MSIIEDIQQAFFYTIGFCIFLGITYLAWISSYVNQLSERRILEEEITVMSSGDRSPSLTEHESDIESSEIEEYSSENNHNQTLRIIIKFLNETQKSLLVNSNDTISKIKRLYFADQLGNNQIIRFIYQGRELQDSQTLRRYNIRDQTIIHCQITNRRRSTSNPNQELTHTLDNSTIFDSSPVRISLHFILLSTFILGFIWYLRIEYRLLFTPISTIILILITIVFFIFIFGPLVSSPHRESIHFD